MRRYRSPRFPLTVVYSSQLSEFKYKTGADRLWAMLPARGRLKYFMYVDELVAVREPSQPRSTVPSGHCRRSSSSSCFRPPSSPLLYFCSFQHRTLLNVDPNYIEGRHSQCKCTPRRFQVRGGERERDHGTPPVMYMVDRPPVILWAESEHLSLMDKIRTTGVVGW